MVLPPLHVSENSSSGPSLPVKTGSQRVWQWSRFSLLSPNSWYLLLPACEMRLENFRLDYISNELNYESMLKYIIRHKYSRRHQQWTFSLVHWLSTNTSYFSKTFLENCWLDLVFWQISFELFLPIPFILPLSGAEGYSSTNCKKEKKTSLLVICRSQFEEHFWSDKVHTWASLLPFWHFCVYLFNYLDR